MGRSQPTNPLALAILACLLDQPSHPYEVARVLEVNHVDESIRVTTGTLYSTVDRLAAQGMIEAQATERHGRRPERTIYAITDAGVAALGIGVAGLLTEPQPEYRPFEAALSLCSVLHPHDARKLLGRRLDALDRELTAQSDSLDARRDREPGSRLTRLDAEHRLAHLRTERAFVADLLENFSDIFSKPDSS